MQTARVTASAAAGLAGGSGPAVRGRRRPAPAGAGRAHRPGAARRRRPAAARALGLAAPRGRGSTRCPPTVGPRRDAARHRRPGRRSRPPVPAQSVGTRRRDTSCSAAAAAVARPQRSAALALDVARRWSPDEVHLLVADSEGARSRRSPASLTPAPWSRPAIGSASNAFVRRAPRSSSDGVTACRAARAPPRLLVLIDGLPALRAELEEARRYDLLDELDRVLAEGPEVGVAAAIAVDRLAGIPAALAATVAQKWLFRPADPAELAMFGLRACRCAQLVPGAGPPRRAGTRGAGRRPWPSRGRRARRCQPGGRGHVRPHPASGRCPTTSRWTTCSSCRQTTTSSLVGVGDADLGPIGLAVRPGDHVLVAGPARSGRTNALGVLALQIRRAHPGAWLGAVLHAPSSAIRRPRCTTSSARGWTSSTSRPIVTRSSSSTTPSASTTPAAYSRRAWHASTPRSTWSPPLGPTPCVRATATGPSWCGAAGWASC